MTGLADHAARIERASARRQVSAERTRAAVKLASRIVGLNRSLESRLLVSEAAWERLGRDAAGVTVHHAVAIRGRVQPERLYQLAS